MIIVKEEKDNKELFKKYLTEYKKSKPPFNLAVVGVINPNNL